MSAWAITIPKTTRWEDYEEELARAAAGDLLNFRVPGFPAAMRPGDRCYVVHDGQVRGWMEIVSLAHRSSSWTCEVTGVQWPSGRYVQRSGPFHRVDGLPMRGFRGVRQMRSTP